MRVSSYTSCAGHRRLAAARAWLDARSACERVLIIGSSLDAANDLGRRLAKEKGAVFGWHWMTLPQFAAILARPLLMRRKFVPINRTSAEALVARVVHELALVSALGRYTEIANGPGFAAAVTGALVELRLARPAPEAVNAVGADAAIDQRYEARLEKSGFADWPPDPIVDGGSPEAEPPQDRWVILDDELPGRLTGNGDGAEEGPSGKVEAKSTAGSRAHAIGHRHSTAGSCSTKHR